MTRVKEFAKFLEDFKKFSFVVSAAVVFAASVASVDFSNDVIDQSLDFVSGFGSAALPASPT